MKATRRVGGRAAAAVLVGTVALGALAAGAPASTASPGAARRADPPGPFATLLFSRTEVTAADNCVINDTGVARLDTVVAPYLTSLGMTGTGTLVTDRTRPKALFCTHVNASMTASWAKASQLATQHGWRFTSHTATYPANLASLPAWRARAETCGSAETIDSHGLPGAHGMISYPGAQNPPTAIQAAYGAPCYAWGRMYGANGVTSSAAGVTAPYWQRTYAANGGPCNTPTAACYTIPATGSQRYRLPAEFLAIIAGLDPGEWFTLQSYVLVTGVSPTYSSSPIRWDCTSSNPRLHWTNDNERYCYRDFQAIVAALDARADITVTDPLAVGVAFGRPATYLPPGKRY